MPKHISSIDFIRVIAILAVVTIHVTDSLVDRTNYFGGISWWISNLLNSASRIAVPLFIMISGYLLLDRQDRRISASHIFRRVGFPLIFWSAIYFIWNYYWKGINYSLSQILLSIFSGSFFHLYFLFIIIGLYIVYPFLSKIFWKSTVNQLKFVTSALFVLGLLLVIVQFKIPSFQFVINAFTIFIPYTGYFLFGGYIRRFSFSEIKVKIYGPLILGLAIFATSLLNYYNRKLLLSGIDFFWSSNQAQFFGENLSPNLIIMSVIAFPFLLLLGSQIFKRFPNLTSLFKILAQTSFGVYLVHPILIDLIDHYANLAIHLITSNLWLYIFEKIFLVYLVSFILVLFLYRIPVIKYVFGEK